MPLGRGASSKSSRTFGSTPPPKINFFVKNPSFLKYAVAKCFSSSRVKNQNEKPGRFWSGCVHTIVTRLLPESLIQAKENYNCDDKYFKFARAIVCKLFV